MNPTFGRRGRSKRKCTKPLEEITLLYYILENAFLFLATHGPIFIASSSSATLIQWHWQCGFQYVSVICVTTAAIAISYNGVVR